jgi:hypothetical protein
MPTKEEIIAALEVLNRAGAEFEKHRINSREYEVVIKLFIRLNFDPGRE